MDPLVNFFAMNSDIAWGGDAESDVVVFHAKHRDGHFITNLKGLSWVSC
jgi:hypothetical protein